MFVFFYFYLKNALTLTSFFNLFLIISAIHGFAFSLVMFFSKYGKNRAIIFLNLLLLSISLNNFQSWFNTNNISIYRFEIPWLFLSAPFFYSFLIHYLEIEKKSVNLLKASISLFFILSLTQGIFVFYYSEKSPYDEFMFLFEKYKFAQEFITFVTSVTLFSFSFYILYKKEKLFPKILSFDNLKWIYSFFKFMLFAYLFWLIALVVTFKLNFSDFIFSYYPLRIFTTIIIYLLGYQGLKYLRIVKEREQIRKNILFKDVEVEKLEEIVIEKSTTDKTEKQFEEIDNYIKKSQKYLQPKYTLQNLANDMGIGTSSLSFIINKNANKSFIDYINEMRVEQSKKLLINEQYINYTIVSIGLESGFNSKSTFYNVFKKHVKKTPLAYKNEQNQKKIS